MDRGPPFAGAWYAQRLAAISAVTEVQDAELRSLTDREALVRTNALLALGAATPDGPYVAEWRRTTSGLVAQQALFARLRR